MQWPHIIVDTAVGKAFEAIVILGAGVVMALLQNREKPWVKSILTGLATSVLLFVFFLGLSMSAAISDYRQSLQPKVTGANVEGKMKDWAYAFGMTAERLDVGDKPEAYFAMRVTPKTKDTVVHVMRLKALPDYAFLSATIELGTEHKSAWGRLSERERTRLREQVRMELSRSRIVNDIPPDLSSGIIAIQRRVPIAALTEDGFVQRVEEIRFNLLLIRDNAARVLDELPKV